MKMEKTQSLYKDSGEAKKAPFLRFSHPLSDNDNDHETTPRKQRQWKRNRARERGKAREPTRLITFSCFEVVKMEKIGDGLGETIISTTTGRERQ